MLGEEIEVDFVVFDLLVVIEVIEDYKLFDVECVMVGFVLLQGICECYFEWWQFVDGDGGDENFKDYLIEENLELMICSVVNNLMFY